GLTRKLPLCPVNDTLSIAAFVMFSDVEMTIACAAALLKKSPDFDVIITAESKGIPLAYEMARQSGKPYILARKSIKLYMKQPVEVEVKSITTAKLQKLYLDMSDRKLLENSKVLVVDDVISTGESLAALEMLVEKSNGHVVGKATALAEGDAANRDDIIFLAPLPPFPHN
ncbi:MAG: phosphoribosyltransferase family protein, partial [Oscillospiraceae bacterium]